MQKLEDYRIENQFSMKTESMIKQGLEQITTAYLKEDYGEKLFEEKDAYIVEDKMKGSIEG